MKRLLVTLSVAVSMAAGAGWAFAGEVKGPPGTVDNTNYTGARTNANSNCAVQRSERFRQRGSGTNRFERTDGGRLVEVLRRAEGHPGQTRSLSRRDERQSRALDRRVRRLAPHSVGANLSRSRGNPAPFIGAAARQSD